MKKVLVLLCLCASLVFSANRTLIGSGDIADPAIWNGSGALLAIDSLILTDAYNVTMSTGIHVKGVNVLNTYVGSAVFSQPCTVDGVIRLQGGVLDFSNYVKVKSNWVVSGAPTINMTGSVVEFNGAAANITITSAGIKFDRIIINNTGRTNSLVDSMACTVIRSIAGAFSLNTKPIHADTIDFDTVTTLTWNGKIYVNDGGMLRLNTITTCNPAVGSQLHLRGTSVLEDNKFRGVPIDSFYLAELGETTYVQGSATSFYTKRLIPGGGIVVLKSKSFFIRATEAKKFDFISNNTTFLTEGYGNIAFYAFAPGCTIDISGDFNLPTGNLTIMSQHNTGSSTFYFRGNINANQFNFGCLLSVVNTVEYNFSPNLDINVYILNFGSGNTNADTRSYLNFNNCTFNSKALNHMFSNNSITILNFQNSIWNIDSLVKMQSSVISNPDDGVINFTNPDSTTVISKGKSLPHCKFNQNFYWYTDTLNDTINKLTFNKDSITGYFDTTTHVILNSDSSDFNGSLNNINKFRSLVDGVQYRIKFPDSLRLKYTDFKDCDASSGIEVNCSDTTNVNSGNNRNIRKWGRIIITSP